MADEVMQETTAEIESETSFDDDNLFDDYEESEEESVEETTDTEETEEETGEDKETEEDSEETTEEDETIDFKFLGQTSKLSKSAVGKIAQGMGKTDDEVVALLQKGTNYENSPLHKLIDKYADANGMNRQEYIKFLEDQLPGLAENIQKNNIAKQHPDWDDEKIELAAKLNLQKMNADRAEKEEKQKAAEEYSAYKPHLDFIAKYPDVKEYPEEVAADIDKGVSPIVAYEAYLQKQEYEQKLSELNKKIAKEERRAKNKATSTGSLKDNDDDGERDLFSEGFGY